MTSIPAHARSVVNRMTNWQRKQWARAGYPCDEVALRHFASLEHP